MEQLVIKTESKEYPAYIGRDVIPQMSTLLHNVFQTCSQLLIITDENVHKMHMEKIKQYLPKQIKPLIYVTPAGEKAKTFSEYEKCITFALENGLDRQSVILAVGGGVVGDLAGFVAASYMRGIRFVQIPTTILAHDSAVGGKVAINHSLGKNMVGAFYQPEAVLYDTNFLQTLPLSELRSGFAEVIKHALIADPLFLNYLMTKVTDLENITDEQLSYILKRGMEIKRDIVSKDEKETGIRAYLNFGHTFGHALETYRHGSITHGEAVMTGIVYALFISISENDLTFSLNDFLQWIEGLGYDWHIEASILFEDLFQLMKRDKKSVSQLPLFVLLKKVGTPELTKVSESLLKEAFQFLIK